MQKNAQGIIEFKAGRKLPLKSKFVAIETLFNYVRKFIPATQGENY